MNLEEATQKFNQAVYFHNHNEFDKAIVAYKSVLVDFEKQDAQAKIYAQAQFNLAFVYEQQEKLEEAILVYQRIQQEQPDPYAQAQLSLGIIYEKQEKLEKAIVAYGCVLPEQQELYAEAQLKLGFIYEDQGKLENAIETYQNILPKHRALYAQAQFNIGLLFSKKGDINNAMIAYQSVPYEEKKLYAQAQFNLGNRCSAQGKLQEAIKAYQLVPTDQQECFAKAQFNLGRIYEEQGYIKEAVVAYSNTPKEEREPYFRAQVNLGILYGKQGKLEDAILAYQVVTEEVEDQYAKAQFNLGNIYRKQGRLEDAILAYKKISINCEEFYIKGLWNLGACYLEQKKYLEFSNQLNSIQPIQEKYLAQVSYHLNLYRKIISKNLIEKLSPLGKKIIDLLNMLIVDQPEDQWIAHYTTPSVAYLMLDHKNQEHPSKLRLNPIDFMNDPTEGALINRLFSLKAQEKPNAQIEQHKSFIGCFTLHHDSLNQFRLYGKENQREASGVSLVLNRKQFFEEQSNFSFVNHNLTNLQEKSVGLDDEQPADFKLPLFRCIYFDPDSGLIHVAQREEWTFCREKGSCQDNDWSDYKDKIDQVNDSVRVLIAEIKVLIKQINPAENSDEAELIEEILLPLRYLIKHYAFKEEQECRTIYITQWNDSRIQLDPKLNRVYVDYQSILPAIEKIFLSVGALHHESALQYLGQTTDKTFIVKRSHNPFRT